MSAMKAIFAGCKALGITEEDDRRDLFERVTGKRGLRLMNASEQEAVVQELRRLGFRAEQAGRRKLDGPYARKLQALWIAGWNLGLMRSREDAALLAFVKRQTGIEHTRFLRDAADATAAVEALKSWLARDGGVTWGNTNGYDWLADPTAKVVWAQWRKLHPEARLLQQDTFQRAIGDVIGREHASLDHLRAADWRAVSNKFGHWIRGDRT